MCALSMLIRLCLVLVSAPRLYLESILSPGLFLVQNLRAWSLDTVASMWPPWCQSIPLIDPVCAESILPTLLSVPTSQ